MAVDTPSSFAGRRLLRLGLALRAGLDSAAARLRPVFSQEPAIVPGNVVQATVFKQAWPNNSFKPSPLRGLGHTGSHRAGRLNSGVRPHHE